MPYVEIVLGQLSDPFRIGLLLALFATMWRTRAASGVVVPLLAGIVFVAVIVPLTLGGLALADAVPAILAGVVANAVIVLAIAAAWALVRRAARAGRG